MKVWIFVILENGFLIIKTALASAIPDISPDTIKQRQRHEHIKMLMIKQNKHTKKKKNVDNNDDDEEFSQNVYLDEFKQQSLNLKTYLKNSKDGKNEIVLNLEEKGDINEMPSLEHIKGDKKKI